MAGKPNDPDFNKLDEELGSRFMQGAKDAVDDTNFELRKRERYPKRNPPAPPSAPAPEPGNRIARDLHRHFYGGKS